jgi:hypothetical protein
VGRDPATLEKTSAVLVRMPGGTGRVMGDPELGAAPPLEGDVATIASGLRAYADLGVAEVQLVVDPIDLVEADPIALARRLSILDQADIRAFAICDAPAIPERAGKAIQNVIHGADGFIAADADGLLQLDVAPLR